MSQVKSNNKSLHRESKIHRELKAQDIRSLTLLLLSELWNWLYTNYPLRPTYHLRRKLPILLIILIVYLI